MEAIVGVVVPPFAIDINEFSLAFQEVSMMLGLPTNTITIVSKGSVVWIPIGDDSTVASERTQVHDSNRSHWIEARRVDRFIQSSVNACFRTSIGQPTFGVGIVRTRQDPSCPIRSVEYGIIIKPSVWPPSRDLFIVRKEQLPAILGQCRFLDTIRISC